MVADPAPTPSGVHVSEPFSLAHSPRRATLTVSMSRSGLTDTSEMLPHSDARPVRFAVTGTQFAVTGSSVVAGATLAGALVVGLVDKVVEVDVEEVVERVILGDEPPQPARLSTTDAENSEIAFNRIARRYRQTRRRERSHRLTASQGDRRYAMWLAHSTT